MPFTRADHFGASMWDDMFDSLTYLRKRSRKQSRTVRKHKVCAVSYTLAEVDVSFFLGGYSPAIVPTKLSEYILLGDSWLTVDWSLKGLNMFGMINPWPRSHAMPAGQNWGEFPIGSIEMVRVWLPSENMIALFPSLEPIARKRLRCENRDDNHYVLLEVWRLKAWIDISIPLWLASGYLTYSELNNLHFYLVNHQGPEWSHNRLSGEACYATKVVKWGFPKMGVPQNGWFIMENLFKIDDLRVSLF